MRSWPTQAGRSPTITAGYRAKLAGTLAIRSTADAT